MKASDHPPLTGEPIRDVDMSPHHAFIKGSKVRRNHCYDGSLYAGTPIGPILTVVELITPPNLGVGYIQIGSWCKLSDGEGAYGWNLTGCELGIDT